MRIMMIMTLSPNVTPVPITEKQTRHITLPYLFNYETGFLSPNVLQICKLFVIQVIGFSFKKNP